jgi:spore coat protein F
MAPMPKRSALTHEDLTAFYAGHLLGFAKTAVRYYAFGITETSTPSLRDTFQRHLNHFIQLHAKVFYFMLERGLYPSYDLPKLLAGDKKNAALAIQM